MNRSCRLPALFCLAIAPALALTGCSVPTSADSTGSTSPAIGAAVSPTGDDTLYRDLGGAEGVERLTADLIREIAADERIRDNFRETDIDRLHRMLQEQFCSISGGGCTYTGDSMKDSHDGLGTTRADFNAMVEALIRAMETSGLAVTTQNRLLAKLAPMHRDIVED